MNYLRDTRQSYKPGIRDHCQTPPYAILPLLPYLPGNWTIWEPAAADGLLSTALLDRGFKVLSSSNDFFQFKPEQWWDCIVTNPPFSQATKWMERCFDLGRPWCLLMKSEIISNQGVQRLFARYGEPEMVYPESRINFKMPFKGWATGSQFNTHWYTFGLGIGRSHTWLCPINEEKREFHKNGN